MMSPSPLFETTASQWLHQMATMRAAIAELKLPTDSTTAEYGHDLLLDDEDLSHTFDNDDILVLLNDLDGYNSRAEENTSTTKDSYAAPKTYNSDWLIQQCTRLARKNGIFDADSLFDHIKALLTTDGNEDELQMNLVEVLGYQELDLVADVISHRRNIVHDLDRS